MAYQWTRQEKFRRGVWSVAIAAVICVGAITGAQLKTDKQKGEVGIVALLAIWMAANVGLGRQSRNLGGRLRPTRLLFWRCRGGIWCSKRWDWRRNWTCFGSGFGNGRIKGRSDDV